MDKQFSVSMNHLSPMIQFVCDQARQSHLKPASINKIELAMDEVLTNIIKHSGLDSTKKISIQCSMIDSKEFQVIVSDEGTPYNLLNHIPKQSNVKTLEGYGIHLIVNLVDRVFYQRKNQTNVLTLIFKRNDDVTH